MSRSYRLFDLMQVLRRHRTPVSTAAHRYIAGSCELRGDFRLSRVDRIRQAAFLGERYPRSRRELVKA